MLRGTVFSLLFGATALALPHADLPKQPLHRRLFGKSFDSVIVGGGTAGLALANRLSANSDITVAVIEAGVHDEITSPESTLELFGIEAVSKLEGVGPSYRMNMRTATSLVNDPIWLAKQYATDFLLKQEGMLTNPISDLLGWEKVPDSLRSSFPSSAQDDLNSFPDDWPEIEYLSAPGYIGNFTSLTGTQPKDGYQYGSILATLVKPLSRGNVTIKSTDTSDKPLINPNWLAHPTDQQVAIAAYKRARQVFNTTFMEPALVEKDEYFPGFDVQSDEDLLNVIRGSVMTVPHASGTSKMGKKDDPMAVIDTSRKVFGTEGLRVVDASSFPFLPPGHPQSTIYALAEKIAAEILAEL
ncbi:hypothetical protein KC354_g7779 [Hortaea werneckii]|nr:hypothetical protein KC354_g7779 [Hortaea werneckii]